MRFGYEDNDTERHYTAHLDLEAAMLRLAGTVLAVTVAFVMPTCAQSLPSDCDGSALDRNVPPDRVVKSCTSVIDAGLAAGDNLSLVYFNRGTAYFAVRQLALAVKDFDQAISLTPSFAAAISQRGTAYSVMGQPARAIQDFDQAIKLNPTKAGPYGNRGTVYMKLGQFQRAIEDYDQAIKFDPTNAAFFANRGSAYAALGQFDKAIQDYDQALKLKPDFSDVASDRCHALLDAGRKPDMGCPTSEQP